MIVRSALFKFVLLYLFFFIAAMSANNNSSNNNNNNSLNNNSGKNCLGDKRKQDKSPEVTGETDTNSQQIKDEDEGNLCEAAGKQPCGLCQSNRSQLETCRAKCQSLEGERDQLKEELKAMEREMEEMHDTFKEEESEQFEQTKQELDLAMKNCKILQIRLHKAERQYGQLEQVKSMLEQQLEESNNRLQQEQHQQSSQHQQESVNFTQIGSDFVKLSTCEYDKLLKDLSDTFEREKDLQEQIKYSQEEAQLKSDRLQSIEGENEILLNKVSKLTLANSRLRAQASATRQLSSESDSVGSTMTTVSDIREAAEEKCELIQENEQLKLALEFAQTECERLKNKLQESQSKLDSLKNALQSSESKRLEFEGELNRLKLRRQASFEAAGAEMEDPKVAEQLSRLELECRQLRSKLVQSERENRQLKAACQSMSTLKSSSSSVASRQPNSTFMSVRGISVPKSHSMDMTTAPQPAANGSEQARYRELNRQLREQCDSLREQNERLEQRLEDLTLSHAGSGGGTTGESKMESDLVEKLKRRLDFSESELAKVRSRLVEMDLECSRVQRQHKRLVESLENSSSDASGLMANRRKVKLPPESVRDSMSRQELRQAVRDLDEELEECLALLRAKDCLISERAAEAAAASQHQQQQPTSGSASTCEEQLKSLRRLLEQERLLSNNLKIDVSSLEETKQELMTNTMMLERERVAMEEELDKLRSLNMELNTDNEDLKRTNRSNSNRLKDLQATYEKVRADLLKAQQQQQQQQRQKRESSTSPTGGDQSPNDMLLMARDLSELKVKNGFLMRQLEIAREENARQMDDLKQAHEIQQRRVVEMAQIELREKHLAESQQLRDELNELKQKLTGAQRQVSRQEEEASGERERLRAMERDWRREKGQAQQKVDQLEAQLSLERRSNEFRLKEIESVVREKERELICLQDKCVQLERDLKRAQNKYSILEENSESKVKSLSKELEAKKRELGDAIATNHAREEHYFEQCKRFNSEKSTLTEALESLRRSYDEKLAELKSSRELLALRQEQSYKERLLAQERLDDLGGQLVKMSEHKTQSRLLEHQLQAQERQVDSLRRDCMQLKEDRGRLKTRCDELEFRCAQYEKQELITKTSSISSSLTAGLFSRAKNSLSSSNKAEPSSTSGRKYGSPRVAQQPTAANREDQQQATGMIERLTSKINDQRHLINLLKEQYDSAQVELKQTKLVQSAEKQKWQYLVNQLQSRLNESEEKLLFETSLTNQTTLENCRRKFELKWSEERKNTMNVIQQQQQQNELLMKDFRKISQQHDLLRLHTKQLEANNQKLSKKLIEYQNQQLGGKLSSSKQTSADSAELRNCLSERENLLRQQTELSQLNSSLLDLLRDQVRPLVETVNKIMTAIESGPPDKQVGADEASTKRLDNSSGFSSRHESADEGSKSTLRPLMTSKSPLHSDSDSLQRDQASTTHISTNPPAQMQHQSSRLSRLFPSKSPSPTAESKSDTKSAASNSSKSVKKVRVKSAALGITPSEKRQLKERLGELSKAIDELSSSKSNPRRSTLGRSRLDHSSVEYSSAPTAAATATTITPSRAVRWQMDESDLESERSWSLQSDAPNRPSISSNTYRRFPQTTPSSHHQHSLTDYESESSLAGSDISLARAPAPGGLRLVSGVESDSCMASSSSGSRLKSSPASGSSSARRRGLKMRFTDTLRNISRSITGLASDSESEPVGSAQPASSVRFKRKDAKSLSSSAAATAAVAAPGGENLKEIRV